MFERRNELARRATYLRKTGRPILVAPSDAEKAKRKVRSFRARGMSFAQMAARSGLPITTVQGVLRNPTMHRSTWSAIGRMPFEAPHGEALIDGTGTHRRVAALWCDGFPTKLIAELSGLSLVQIRRTVDGTASGQVRARSADAIGRLYAELESRKPGEFGITGRSVKWCRNFATKRGGVPRTCWDADTIDDPEAIPEWTGACGTADGLRIHQREGIPACPACHGVNLGPATPRIVLDPAKLRSAREARGLSLVAVGKIMGISDSTVHYWETGRSAPRNRYTIDRLLAVLDLNPEEAT